MAYDEEVERLYDIVRKEGPLPTGVRKIDFRFGEDSTGAPAIWIVLVVRNELNPSSETIGAMRHFAEKVRSKVRTVSDQRWPYVTIEAE